MSIVSGDVTVEKLIQTGLYKGKGTGYVCKYNNTLIITIKSGWIEANGKIYSTNSFTHSMTSLDTGFDIHYIYIDDDASTPPDAIIIDSITEPAFNQVKNGWYNGNDRCIGAVVSPNGSATLAFFETVMLSGNTIQYIVDSSAFTTIASNMNPNGSWQAPSSYGGVESSTVLPVNATAIYFRGGGADADSVSQFGVTTQEANAAGVSTSSGQILISTNLKACFANGWINLGISRNIRLYGQNDDDNTMYFFCRGFQINR